MSHFWGSTRNGWKCAVPVLLLCVASSVWADNPSTGLKFADPADLLGVPIASTPFSGAALPATVDLTKDLPPAGQQGRQNSCVAWTLAYSLKTFHEKQEERLPVTTPTGALDASRVFSPTFVYNQINRGQDGGALFEDGFNVLSQQGAASLAHTPYTEGDYLSQPSQAAKNAAQPYKIDFWRQVNTRDTKEVKAQLAAGFPVAIGALIDEGFASLRPGGVWQSQVGNTLGGHAMLLVGYDDAKSAFRVMNSWGTQWGDGGLGWIDYGYFPRVVREAYVAKDANNGPGPTTPIVGPNPPSPTPLPSPALASLTITNVTHNVSTPHGPGVAFAGNIEVPPGAGRHLYIVIQIHFNDGAGGKGPPTRALFQQFATVQWQAATGTPALRIPELGVRTTWRALLPYGALDVPRGQMIMTPYGPQMVPSRSELVAEPVLFIDDFGVSAVPPIPFFVML